jgi:peptidoglycan/LPS O-acetylase OafA/YrhL
MTASPPTTTPSLSRIDELDGLRGILALWVALSHIFCWCGFTIFPLAVPHVLASTVGRFWVQFSFAGGAVDTFIILSGFAISFMLHARPQTYRQFMTGRFFRIYPVYLLCLLAGFGTVYLMPFVLNTAGWQDNEYFNLYVRPVLAAAQAHPAAHLAAHLTLLFGIIPEKILPHGPFTLLAPAWSITLEWQYYLLAPFLAVLVRRPAGLLALGLVASGDLIYTHFWSGAFLPDKLPLFLIGIGSYHLYANAEKLKSFRYRPHVLAGLAAAVLATGWHWLALLIWLVVFGCVLADGNNPAEQFMLKPRRFLLRPAMQFVGKISYPLYLVHWPVILCLMAGLIWWQPGISSGKALALMFVAGLPVILFAAWLLHISVEKPLMQFGKKFTR